MSTNPFQPPEHESYSSVDESVEWSESQRICFLAAAVPALLLPVCYVLAILYGLPGVELPFEVRWLVWPGSLYALMIQLPIYIVWIARSQELTSVDKFCWIGMLLCFNMLAIPLLLLAKYRRATVSSLRSGRST